MNLKAVHLMLKDNECDLCEYKTAIKANVNSHVRAVHEKQRRFHRDQCDYKSYVESVSK